jgi:polyisoprenyl-phosphate glycosyltransferase
MVITLDADLQDDPTIMREMINKFDMGSDIVYAVRRERKLDTWFKRESALFYYKFLSSMGVELVPNHADFRLLSRRAVEALRQYEEVNLFLRGIIPQLGFKHDIVYYDRKPRIAGETKYPLRKMLTLAVNGLTSFSMFPLRFIAFVGIFVSFSSFLIGLWALAIRLFTQNAVAGWASTVLPMYFLGGLQLFSLGLIGEYIGQIYKESKRRPRYIIEKKI